MCTAHARNNEIDFEEEVYCSYWGLNSGLYAKQKALCGTGLSS